MPSSGHAWRIATNHASRGPTPSPLDIIQSAALSTVEAVTETTLEAPSAPPEEAPLHPILEKYGGDPLRRSALRTIRALNEALVSRSVL